MPVVTVFQLPCRRRCDRCEPMDAISGAPIGTAAALLHERSSGTRMMASVRGRLRFVPFNATFDGREDLTLETRLADEAPGYQIVSAVAGR